MCHTNRLALFIAMALVALGCASTAASREPTKAWSQQIATDLAGQLASATEAAYTGVFNSPESQMLDSERAGESMAGSLRQMHEEAVGLRGKLEEGKGMADTLNEYRRIKELSRDVDEASGFTDLAASQAGPLSGVSSILGQLDAYYGAQ